MKRTLIAPIVLVLAVVAVLFALATMGKNGATTGTTSQAMTMAVAPAIAEDMGAADVGQNKTTVAGQFEAWNVAPEGADQQAAANSGNPDVHRWTTAAVHWTANVAQV